MNNIAELEWDWDDDNPSSVGWHAVARCWDPEEGTFVGVSYWTGVEWATSFPITNIVGFAGPFLNKQTALDWALEHDLDG